MDMRISVLATEVRDSERRKQVEARDMQSATTSIGRPPACHCAAMPPPRTARNTTARKMEAKTLRHRFVVHGPVVTRRAMRPPLLQQSAAQATSRTPRRAAGIAGFRRIAIESDETAMKGGAGRRACYQPRRALRLDCLMTSG